MSNTGKYVKGNTTAENTIEYSVIFTGSIDVSASAVATITETSNTVWNSGARRSATSFPQLQPKYCATTYTFASVGSSDAPNIAAKKPTSTTARPALPSCSATGSAAWSRCDTLTPAGPSTSAAVVMIAIAMRAPIGKPR